MDNQNGSKNECPVCFNCNMESDKCFQFAECDQHSGVCICPAGFGGASCSIPLGGNLGLDHRPSLINMSDPNNCNEGWGGLICNVCENDFSCQNLVPNESNVTCYRGADAVHSAYGFCNVTNQGFLPLLGMNHITKAPELTVNFDNVRNTCDFQLWIDRKESFYCKLTECEMAAGLDSANNISTVYSCKTMKCECNPGQLLCDPQQMDLSEFFSDTENGPKGPGRLSCTAGENKTQNCVFEEDAMNNLLQLIIGESNIQLSCDFGECMATANAPSYGSPDNPSSAQVSVVAALAAVALASLIMLSVLLCRFWLLRRQKRQQLETRRWYEAHGITPPSAEADAWSSNVSTRASVMMAGHVPVTLTFEDLGYSIRQQSRKPIFRKRHVDENEPLLQPQDQVILTKIIGQVEPGQLMAIMGGSGAGKTTFLELLALKQKSGEVCGSVYVNGKSVSPRAYRKIVGFVDQDDYLLPTLTVYETILYSALLRLPRNMPLEAKKSRVQEAMMELGISEIADRRIGQEDARGISGGEKRRVSIACELVSNPSILFLDEPTSGLDSFNAYNVVESLARLAKEYKRTILMTIHQPRSNIFQLFDSLVLLSKGQLVYSGPTRETLLRYFASISHACPPGYNIADFLVDLTMSTSDNLPSAFESSQVHSELQGDIERIKSQAILVERGNSSAESVQVASADSDGIALEGARMPHQFVKRLSSRFENLFRSTFGENTSVEHALSDVDASLPWTLQFSILAQRTFKNVSRNPALLQTHMLVSLMTGPICGFLFWQVGNDIAGFQNRLGFFFFTCCLFVFECLSSVHAFASERVLFCRERAKGYYSPFSYYITKVLFDLVPLRIVPPIVYGLLAYYMVGLRAESLTFLFKFLLMLVGLNLAAACLCLLIGIVLPRAGMANLTASLVMLFEMLFGGLLLNTNAIPYYLKWLQKLSFFNHALEALLINEVVGLKLYEHKLGLNVQVPGELILDAFGFNHRQSQYYTDFMYLSIILLTSITVGYVYLLIFVKERR